MSGLRVIQKTAEQWGVSPALHGVLRSSCPLNASHEAAGGRDAGCDRAFPGFTWPGQDFGARQPGTGETPLSPDEVWHGVREGLIP